MAPAFNVVLRIGTLGTRFTLVFILAKYLDATALGYYGLFTAAIGYALLFVGLDLHVYTTREIAKVEAGKRGRMLKSQVVVVGLIYLLLLPLGLALLPLTGLPRFLLFWFVPILLLEHINQELFRLLVILSKQISASLLLFLRQGSWALVATGLMIADDTFRNLTMIMAVWAGAGIAALSVGLWTLKKQQFGGWGERTDWGWIRRGLVVSGSFLVATLALRAIQTFDRYWLNSLAGIEVVGAYVLFFGVASALNVFLDAAIFSFRYPELVNLSHRQRYLELHERVVKMALLTVWASLIFLVISSAILPLLLHWVGKDIYSSRIEIYYFVLAATIAYSVSMVSHYGLYALGRDRDIIISHIASLIVFGVATMVAAKLSFSNAVPLGVLAAMMTVLIWKTLAYSKASRKVLQGDFPAKQ